MTAPGDGTTIDATTQTTFTGDTNTSGPEVVLDGSTQATYEFAGVFGPAFILRQANCAIKGFVIHSYDEQGISLTSDPASGSIATGKRSAAVTSAPIRPARPELETEMQIIIPASRSWAAPITTRSVA